MQNSKHNIAVLSLKPISIYRCILAILLSVQVVQWFLEGPNATCFYTNILLLLCGWALCIHLYLSISSSAKNQNIALSIHSVFVGLIIGETTLWLTQKNLTYNEIKTGKYYSERTVEVSSWYKTYTPSSVQLLDRMPEFMHESKSYSNGLIDTFAIPSFTNCKKVITLGDSFTEGVGAMGVEHSWPKVLERLWSPTDSSNTQLLNAGIAGSDPIFSYKLFADKLMAENCNLLLLCVNESDIRDVAVKGGLDRFKADGTVTYLPHPIIEYVYASSYLSRLFLTGLFDINSSQCTTTDYKKSVAIIHEINYRLHQLGKEKAFRYALIILPTQAELTLGNPYLTDLHHQALKAGIESYDLTNDIVTLLNKKALPADSIYWPIDRHFNRKGYQIVANIIAEKLNTPTY